MLGRYSHGSGREFLAVPLEDYEKRDQSDAGSHAPNVEAKAVSQSQRFSLGRSMCVRCDVVERGDVGVAVIERFSYIALVVIYGVVNSVFFYPMRALLCSLLARVFGAVHFSARHQKSLCTLVVRSEPPSHGDSPDIEGSTRARRDDPYLPHGRRLIAMLRRELSDEQIVALDIRDFIAAVKGEDGQWTLLGEEQRPR